VEIAAKLLRVTLSGAVSSTDLGSSSNYSNENFEDRITQRFTTDDSAPSSMTNAANCENLRKMRRSTDRHFFECILHPGFFSPRVNPRERGQSKHPIS